MIITDEMVERAAEAGYREYWRSRTDKAWEKAGPLTRGEWLKVALAALEVALGGKDHPND